MAGLITRASVRHSVTTVHIGRRKMSPAKSKAQQRMMGAELARKRAGKKTRTGMSEAQLREYATTPRKGLPTRAKPRKGR